MSKEVDVSKYSVGCMVARFQINELHEGHHYVIKQVIQNHKKAIIFLGVPKFVGTKKNPLDFDTRKKMVQESYPDVVVAPLPDQGNNQRWARELDRRIQEIYPHGEILLYGGRDSFIPYYKDGGGKFDTKELEPLGVFAGADVRKLISEEVKNSSDFRSGVIYHAYNLFPRVVPTVDVVPIDGEKFLMARKYNESEWRFIGGFVKPEDNSNEMAARRVFYSETGRKSEPGDMEYLGSCYIPDWRFRGEEDRVMTTLFKTKCLWGTVSPSEDIAELRWFGPNDSVKVVKEHCEIFKMFYTDYKKEKDKIETE